MHTSCSELAICWWRRTDTAIWLSSPDESIPVRLSAAKQQS